MKNTTKKIIAFLIPTVLILSATLSFGQQEGNYNGGYTPLEPSAFGLTQNQSMDTGNLSSFLSYIFDFAIAIAVALAVVMIAFGGIQYMTTDSWTGKQDGKGKIENAFYGLALALISWLILYIINPNLVNFTSNTIVNKQ